LVYVSDVVVIWKSEHSRENQTQFALAFASRDKTNAVSYGLLAGNGFGFSA
jgi:hypothetical protein